MAMFCFVKADGTQEYRDFDIPTEWMGTEEKSVREELEELRALIASKADKSEVSAISLKLSAVKQ